MSLPVLASKALPALTSTTRSLPQLFKALAGTPVLLSALTTPFNHPGQWSDGIVPIEEYNYQQNLNERLNRGYDMKLLQDDVLKQYDKTSKYMDDYGMNDAVSSVIPGSVPLDDFYLIGFPSDSNQILPYESDSISPAKVSENIRTQPNLREWYDNLMSENSSRPAIRSAINMLINNPSIGL